MFHLIPISVWWWLLWFFAHDASVYMKVEQKQNSSLEENENSFWNKTTQSVPKQQHRQTLIPTNGQVPEYAQTIIHCSSFYGDKH